VSTASVTINAAFLQEIKEVHQDLWQSLRDARTAASRVIESSADWRKLAAFLGKFRDQIALHFALEEAYGYFEDPLDVAPRLCRRAEALRAEHADLYAKICRVVDRAEQLQYSGADADASQQVAEELKTFLDQFESHETRENELVLEAFYDDIGVGD
jgi:hemerythrin-like domain-containing protein